MVKRAVLIAFSALIIPSNAFAARSVTISSDKASLFGDEEMQLSAVASGFTDGEKIYVKGAFYQDGSTNYFGYTKNADTWVKNGDSTTNQRAANIGSWDGNLIVKSDFADSGYQGEGDYKLKLGFYYTSSTGTLQPVSWSTNSLLVSISQPDPTPTPTPSPSPSPTPTAPKSPSPTPSTRISPLISPKISPQVLAEKSASASGASVSATPNPSPSPSPKISSSNTKLASIFAGSGLAIIGASFGFYLWYKKVLSAKNQDKEESDKDSNSI